MPSSHNLPDLDYESLISAELGSHMFAQFLVLVQDGLVELEDFLVELIIP